MLIEKLVLATFNHGKVREITEFLSGIPLKVLGLNDFQEIRVVEESGSTFAENAILKARGYAGQTGIATLADDSGLEVDALGGRPGVYSARYAGESATDEERYQRLLEELSGIPSNLRTARFVCSMAMVDESGQVLTETSGVCEGRIGIMPFGSNGFGYDPVFVPDGFDRTFGQLADEVKSSISHRARAFVGISEYLKGSSSPRMKH